MTNTASKRVSTSLSLPVRVADLPDHAGLEFQLTPDADSRKALAGQLDLLRLRKLGFHGRLVPEGRHDWRLRGRLGATVVQACVVTGAPVTTRIEVPVERLFVRDMPPIEAPEMEMPEDDSLEPLTPVLELGAVMAEALALALPDYPRAEGAAIPEAYAAEGAAEAGDTPDPEARPNPFAVLAALKRQEP